MNGKSTIMAATASFLVISYVGFSPTGLSEEEKVVFKKASEEPVDATKGQPDTCPIHKVKMSVQKLPIVYGFPFLGTVRCENDFHLARNGLREDAGLIRSA